MEDYIENFLIDQDKKYQDKYFEPEEGEEGEDLDVGMEDSSLHIKASGKSKSELSKSVFEKKSEKIRNISDIIHAKAMEMAIELEKLIEDVTSTDTVELHKYSDLLLDMNDFTEDLLKTSVKIHERAKKKNE